MTVVQRLRCDKCKTEMADSFPTPRDAAFAACRAGWDCSSSLYGEDFCPACKNKGGDAE